MGAEELGSMGILAESASCACRHCFIDYVPSMVFVTGYVVFVIFGVYGFLEMVRDKILLEFAHWLFD